MARIGIDCDGVLRDLIPCIKDSIKRYFCNDKIIFHKLKDHYVIYQQDDDNDFICMKDYRVIIQNNRLKFQIMEVK